MGRPGAPLHTYHWEQPNPANILRELRKVEYDARQYYAANGFSWTDLARSLVLTPNAGQVTATVDGAYFGGLPVFMIAAGSGIVFRALAPSPPIFVAGSRPYAAWMGRIRGGTGALAFYLRVLDLPQGANTLLLATSAGGATTLEFYSTSSVNVPFNDTRPHFFEFFINAAGECELCVDGVTLGKAGTGNVIANDSGDLSLAGNATAGGPSNTSHAHIVFCSAVPSAAQRAQLRAFMQRIWGPLMPPLPASAVECWHSEFGASASAAVGQIAGTSLAAIGTPSVAVDPGFFNGRPAYQSVASGDHGWRGSVSALNLNTGARPWVYTVARMRGVGGSDRYLTALGTASSAQISMAGNTTNRWGRLPSVPAVLTNGVADVQCHRFKAWVAGTTAHFSVDDTDVTNASSGALTANCTTKGLGTYVTSTGITLDASIVFDLICSTQPTAAEEAALDDFAKSYWGSA